VQLLATTHLKADFDAVARVLRARESRAAQAEAQLKATLADALRKVQAQEDLRGRASIAEAEEDSARQLRIAEDEARALIRSAVAKIHEAGEKKQDELSAHLDAVLDKLQALRRRQGEDLYASMAMIIEETEAKLKASFSKIHAPLKHAERDGVASQEMHADTVITVPSQEMHAATEITGPCQEQGEQRVGEMVNDGARAAADGSGGVTLKRKADAVENLGVSPVQISGALEERMVADTLIPPGFSFSPTSRSFSSSSMPPKKPDRAVPSQETHANTPLTVATRSIPVGQQGNQPVGEMVKKGGRAAADGSGGMTLKRKADAMENIGVSPVQIARGLEERIMEAIRVPHRSNPTPLVSSSSLSHEKSGLCSYNSVSQVVKVSANVSKGLASVEGSGKTATLNEPTPLEKIGGVLAPYAPSEKMQDQGEENIKTPPAATPTPSHNNMSQGQQGRVERPKRLLIPNKKYAETSEGIDRTTVSKRGRGRGCGHGHGGRSNTSANQTAPQKKEKNKNKFTGRGRGRGCGHGHGGRSNTSANQTAPQEKEKNKNNFTGSHSLGIGHGQGGSNTANPVWVAHSLNRPSPVCKALPPTVQKYPASLEDGSQSTNIGAEMNIASGHAIPGTMGISHEEGDYGSNTGGNHSV
jgi:hypothetical protein